MSTVLKRTFFLSDVLTVTSGIILSSHSRIFDLIRFMTGEEKMVGYELLKLKEATRQAILQQRPEFASVMPPMTADLSKDRKKKAIRKWLSKQQRLFGNNILMTAEHHIHAEPVKPQVRIFGQIIDKPKF